MGEKNLKETKRNILLDIQNHPFIILIGLVGTLYVFYQIIVEIILNAIANIDSNLKGLVPTIVLTIVLILVIFYLLRKNKKLNSALESLPFDQDDLAEMKNMGITRCTSKLEDTDFDPNNCMNTIKRKLFFLGVGGAKWIQKPPSKLQLFRKMLLRIMANNGEVLFLIINPCGASFKLLEKQREGDVNNYKTYKIWLDLVKEFTCLKVRCYDHTLTFRLQFMDDHLMAVSRYQFDKEQYDNYNQGWDSPHLIIDNTNDMSFYTVFEQYFYREWREAKDIDKIDKIKELIEHE